MPQTLVRLGMGSRMIGGRFEVFFNRLLGRGGFGEVYRALDHSSEPPLDCAAKTMPSRQVEVVRAELAMMRAAQDGSNHESIAALIDTVEEAGMMYIFIELATGGELFDRLIDAGRLSEKMVLPYAANLLSALAHCHRRGVVHRDVKLENVMLQAEDPDAIKLVDFGLAVRVQVQPDGSFAPRPFYDGVGSPAYKAPELFAARSGYLAPPVDSWSTGIMLFTLLGGFFPWEHANATSARYKKFVEAAAQGVGAVDHLMGAYKQKWRASPEAKELIDALLTIDPARRMSILEANEHKWIARFREGGDEDDAQYELVYRCLSSDLDDEAEELPELALRPQRQLAAIDIA